MATATVLLASPAALQDGHVEFTTSFLPPSNVSGRSCYLKVTNVSISTPNLATTDFPLGTTFFVTMDIPQVFSYASVSNPILPVTTVTDSRIVLKNNRNIVVGLVNSAYGDVTDNVSSVFSSSSHFPRILVEIPDGPQYIKVGLWAGVNELTHDIDLLTVFFELTPIDTPDKPDLSI
jgi:hypothetical protein